MLEAKLNTLCSNQFMENQRRKQEMPEDEELKEGSDRQSSEDDGPNDKSLSSISSRGRGRPKLPTLWSRVMHITNGMSSNIKEHWVVSDIQLQSALRTANQLPARDNWAPFFFPKDFVARN